MNWTMVGELIFVLIVGIIIGMGLNAGRPCPVISEFETMLMGNSNSLLGDYLDTNPTIIQMGLDYNNQSNYLRLIVRDEMITILEKCK